MSLILREKTEKILKDAGLPEFHTQISNKNMQIVGQCGQPITTIKGILFSRNAPSIKEIDYSVKLFKEFLDAHIDTLKQYKEIRKEAKALVDFRSYNDLFADIKEIQEVRCNIYGSSITVNYLIESIGINTSESKKGMVHNYTNRLTVTEHKEALKKITKLEPKFSKIFKIIKDSNEVNKRLDVVKRKLQQCDI